MASRRCPVFGLRRYLALLLVISCHIWRIESSKVLQMVYEHQLFHSHEITEHELNDILVEHRNSLRDEEMRIIFSCGSLDVMNNMQSYLQNMQKYTEIARINHLEMTGCLVSRLSHNDLNHLHNVIPSELLDHENLPSILKIHQSVFDYLPYLFGEKERRTTSEHLSKNQYVEGIPSPEGMSLTIQFIRDPEVENQAEILLREVFSSWKETQHSHWITAATQREKSGKWKKLFSHYVNSAGVIDHKCDDLSISLTLEYERWTARINDLSAWSNGENILCFLSLIESIASHALTLSISLQGRPVLLNYDAKGFVQSGGMSTPLFDDGIFGSGEVVGVADSGVDDYSCYFWDNSGSYSSQSTTRSGYLSPTLERNRRKIVEYISYADGSDTEAGHGTHVVGIIVGNSIFADFSGGNGLAPAAKVAFYDIMASNSPYLQIPDTYSYLYPTLYNSGAKVLSNSWGSYSTESKVLFMSFSRFLAQYSERQYDADNFLFSRPVWLKTTFLNHIRIH